MEQTNVASIRDDDAGVTYVPFIATDGRVGYRCRADNGRETYLYFNPSTGSDDLDHTPNVFVYLGPYNDPVQDSPETYIDVGADLSPMGGIAEPCCLSFCGSEATHKAGNSIRFPLCDAHYEQLS